MVQNKKSLSPLLSAVILLALTVSIAFVASSSISMAGPVTTGWMPYTQMEITFMLQVSQKAKAPVIVML